MKTMKLTFLIGAAILSCIGVQGQPAYSAFLLQRPPLNPCKQVNKSIIFALPSPPDDIGEPGRREEAGSRRACGDNEPEVTNIPKLLTALVPIASSAKSQLVWGLTTSERPTFWFYVPYSASSTYAEFVLKDAADNQTEYKIPLNGTPGVVSVKVPDTAAPLLVNQQYHWYFNIYCQQNDELLGFVEGSVQRKALNTVLKSQLEQATPRQQVAIYASGGIWHEALTTLAQLRRTSSQDESLARDWANLLQSVGLENLASQPIVNCCNAPRR